MRVRASHIPFITGKSKKIESISKIHRDKNHFLRLKYQSLIVLIKKAPPKRCREKTNELVPLKKTH